MGFETIRIAFVLLEHKTRTCMITFQRILGMHKSLKEGDSLTQAANSSFNKACLHLLISLQLELMRCRQGDHHCSFFQWLSAFCVYDKASISLGLCKLTWKVIYALLPSEWFYMLIQHEFMSYLLVIGCHNRACKFMRWIASMSNQWDDFWPHTSLFRDMGLTLLTS